MNLRNYKIHVFGAGPIGLAHHDAFKSLGCDVRCINQSGGSKVTPAGYNIDLIPIDTFEMGLLAGCGVVISLPIKSQIDVYSQVIEFKPDFVLLEKPGSFDLLDLRNVENKHRELTKTTYVGYNRRFFRSVTALKKILESDQVYSIAVDWSENISRLLSLVSDEHVLENWHLANSCHMFDLAMFLSGSDKYSLKYGYVNGQSKFNSLPGRGLFHMTSNNSVSIELKFNFMQSGSWSAEVVSSSGRYRLAPLERLARFDEQSFSYQPIKIEDNEDSLKEGFAEQARAVLFGSSYLCDFNTNLNNLSMLDELLKQRDGL